MILTLLITWLVTTIIFLIISKIPIGIEIYSLKKRQFPQQFLEF